MRPFRVFALLLVLLPIAACQPVSESVRAAEGKVDAAIDLADDAICKKHFPLRAYEEKYGDRWADLVTFCQWDTPPVPAPGSKG